MQPETTPVVIVGAGPVGLSAALFLTRLGIRPIVLERHSGTSLVPRATGVHVRTLELYRVAGVEQQIRAVGRELTVPDDVKTPTPTDGALPRIILRTTTLAGIDDAIVLEAPQTQPAEISPCPPVWCGQDVYEPILTDLLRQSGAQLLFGTGMESFEADDDGVTVLARQRDDGSTRTIRARYLIAADGVRSGVREKLGIGRGGEGSAGHAMSILFHADLDPILRGRRFIICYIATPEAPGVLVSLDGRERWVLAVSFDPDKGQRPEDFTPERCVSTIRAAVGKDDLAVDVKAAFPWESAHLVADSYRRGPVFLAGDSAHVHPPAGGFGANAGVQDAHNLAWKLAAVLNGWAGEHLLDSYEPERRPVGLATADQAWLRDGARARQAAAEGRIRDHLSVILGYQYHSDAIIGAPPGDTVPAEPSLDGRPGTRAPHIWLRRDGTAISSIDLFEDAFVLLAGRDAGGWADAAATAAKQLGVPLRTYQVGDGLDLAETGTPWHEAYGVTEAGASLVRPDGFVAWRSGNGPGAGSVGVLTDALTTICGTGMRN
ncbi:MAG TPA: FAD-dependent monooxygenase [Streptosporangiaceae bacterium]|nr:FAD-dependent monooxygenase [Streptosporangiaceae bacterium]